MADADRPWRDEDELRRLQDRGLTQQQMADRLGCSRDTIRNWMQRYGIDVGESTPDRHTLAGQLYAADPDDVGGRA